jgi:OPT family oligopeptide transporter
VLLHRHYRDLFEGNNSLDRHGLDDHDRTLFRRIKAFMSESPLLLRSSPGLGTSPYGSSPVNNLTDINDKSWNDVRKDNAPNGKGRRPNRTRGLNNGRISQSSAHPISNTSPPDICLHASNPRLRRRSSLSTASDAPHIAEDAGLWSRFGTGGLPISTNKVAEGSDTSKEDQHASETSSEEATEDDSTTDDDEDPSDNSRYPQVRASVSAVDNTALSINTPRMWILSIFFAIIGSSTNLFFSLRYPSVYITPVIALLLVHPLGLLWDQLLKRQSDPMHSFVDGARCDLCSEQSSEQTHSPNSTLRDPTPFPHPSSLSRLRLWLAQGHWNEKEHTCVYISSNVSFAFAFATDVIVEQTRFYNQDVTITYQLLLTLSTQILGYAFAGLCRRFLVRPGGMIWPGTLMSAAMFTTLHKEGNVIANGWRITRWKFFFVVWTSAVLFYFLPGLLMPALSYFSVITWFAPKNVVISNLFGVTSGLGLFPVTFDWAQIAYIGSPLLTPFWAAMNVVGGLIIVMWVIAPIAYYSNAFYSSYMPILSSSVYDNTGNVYNVSRILTSGFMFDKEAYESYSRVFLPITYVLSYSLQFAGLASLLSHTACWHGRDIWKQWRISLDEVEGESKPTYEALPAIRSAPTEMLNSAANKRRRRRLVRSNSNSSNIISQEDVHNRLMRRYKDAPLSWYLITFLTMTAVGIFVVE